MGQGFLNAAAYGETAYPESKMPMEACIRTAYSFVSRLNPSHILYQGVAQIRCTGNISGALPSNRKRYLFYLQAVFTLKFGLHQRIYNAESHQRFHFRASGTMMGQSVSVDKSTTSSR